jgi:XTP/dITP diphosphohydrolase
MTTLVLATRNRKKLVELDRILRAAGLDVDLLTLDDVEVPEVVESGATFAENAVLKAVATAAATGLTSVADDSGLAVDALNGMPGVLSARWAGLTDTDTVTKDRANNDLLLAQLADVPDERRGAEFRCSVVLVVPGSGEPEVRGASGRMRGRVIREMRGSGGFGYDVLFCADGHDVTTAEMDPDSKDAVSHRGEALRAIAPVVADALSRVS